MRPLRVGLVCPYSFDAHGGVQSHVRELASVLRGLGHHSAVLAPGEGADAPSYVTTTGRTVPMPYNGSVARVAFGPLVAARVRRWLDDGGFDVVHVHEPASPSVSVLALWATRRPVVATFHTAHTRGGRSRVLETSAATFLRPGLARIGAHVAVSDEAARTMRRYLDATPVVVPNGIHVARFAEGARVAGPPTLVFVGRLDEPRKGLRVLLDALPAVLRRQPRARLVVVGAGSAPPVAPALRGAVELVGAVDEATKARLLRSADVFVAPHRHGESFGIVLAEAMAAGAAVVASDLPAFRRVLGEGRYGDLVPPGDPAALAAAVSALLTDPQRRRDLAARAQAAAAAYDWSVVAPALLEVYDGLLAGERLPDTG